MFLQERWRVVTNNEYNFILIIKQKNPNIDSQLPTNCLSVFDHFVGLVLKGLNQAVVVSDPFVQ